MKKEYIKKFKNLNIYIILFTVSTILFGILLQNKSVLGHDSFFHISNIVALKNSILSGNWFFPKIYPIIANDFGYGTGLFYGGFFHYITAILSLVIDNFYQLSILNVMKIMNFTSFFLSGIFMFHFAEKIFKNKNISLLVSIIYMTFPYRLSDIFVRDAYLESIAFTFIPLIFNGIYELLYNKEAKKFYTLFILGTSCLILTHIITALYTFIFGAIFLLLNYKKLLNLYVIKKIVIATIFILCLTSFYTVPLIEQKIYTNNNIFQPNTTTSAQSVSTNALELSKFFPFNDNQSFDGIQFFIFIPTILMFVYTMLVYKKSNLQNKKIILHFIILGLLALFMASNLFLWKIMPEPLLFIQFPWRLLLLASFFISISAASFLTVMKKDLQTLTCLIISILLIYMQLSVINTNRVMEYSVNDIDISNAGIGAINDYFPTATLKNYEYYKNRNGELNIISGDGELNNIQIKTNYISFEANINSEPIVVELPRLYYYGYNANCDYSADNIFKEKPLLTENSNGFVELKIKESCGVSVSFTGSIITKLSYYITIISVILYFIFIRRGKYTNEK